MIKIWKSSDTQAIYISGVTFGNAEDLTYEQQGDNISIKRVSSDVSETDFLKYDEYANKDGVTFTTINALTNYLDDLFTVTTTTLVETEFTLTSEQQLLTEITYTDFVSYGALKELDSIRIDAVGVNDVDNVSTNEANLIDEDYENLCYNNSSTGTVDKSLPFIDLGSVQQIDIAKVWWWNTTYLSSNFKIQGTNDLSNIVDIRTGLSSTEVGLQEIVVDAEFRYIRVFCVQGVHPTYVVLSELEAHQNSGEIVFIVNDPRLTVTVENGFMKLENTTPNPITVKIQHNA